MTTSALARPDRRPRDPRFSSGPTVKRPGWSLACLDGATLGRSHRGRDAKAKLQEVIGRSRALLGLPEDTLLAIVPGSDTGAVEAALWSLLGARGVDVLAWESFGRTWAQDIESALGIEDLRVMTADYGDLPDLSQVDPGRDVVFTWNGTTSGVCVPDGNWIPADREGLTICDATSAVFAMELPWDKLDVVTWSWQKALGGEAGHGMLALSPRAVARLESHRPPWPVPKLFRLAKDGVLDRALFEGATLNTPSLLCVEDALDGLRWAEGIGGLGSLIARSQANLAAVAAWVADSPWADFLAGDPASRSSTSICLKLADPWFRGLAADRQAATAKAMAAALEAAGVGYDLGSYRAAPPGLRLWGGPTVEADDLAALLPWLDWAFAQTKNDHLAA